MGAIGEIETGTGIAIDLDQEREEKIKTETGTGTGIAIDLDQEREEKIKTETGEKSPALETEARIAVDLDHEVKITMGRVLKTRTETDQEIGKRDHAREIGIETKKKIEKQGQSLKKRA